MFTKKSIPKWIAGTGILLMCASLFATTWFAFLHFYNVFPTLMGKEIASGNILLANSYSTEGLSNYAPYSLVEAFFALFTSNSRVIHGLAMIALNSMLFIAIYHATKTLLGKKPNIFIILSFAAIFSVQTRMGNGLDCNWAHIPLLSLAIVCLYYGSEKFDIKIKLALIGLFALWCDKYDYLYFLIPFGIENLINYIRTRKFDRRLIYVGIGLVVHFVLTILRSHLSPEYTIFVYDYSNHRFENFTHIEKIWDRFAQLYTSFSYWFSALFFGKKIINSIPNLIFAAIMVFTLTMPFLFTKKLIKEYKETDNNTRLLTFLSLSAVIMFFVLWLSQASVFHGEQRYLAGIVINAIILACYWLDKNSKTTRIVLFSPFIFLFIMALSFTQNSYRMNGHQKLFHNLIKVLEQEGLSKGLAGLHLANPLNFYANRTIVGNLGNEIGDHNHPAWRSWDQGSWLSNNDIYDTSGPFNFFVSEKVEEKQVIYFSDSEIRQYLGEPKKTIDVELWRIYIYDDITSKVQPNRVTHKTFGFSDWEGTRRWTDGRKVQTVVEKEKKLLSFKIMSRAPSMRKIDVFFNGNPIETLDMATIKDGDLIKIPLPPSDVPHNLLLLKLDKPSRPIDWAHGKNKDKRLLGIMVEDWKVE